MNRRVKLGTASRRRIRSGGPLAKGRPSISLHEWTALKARIYTRACWRCEHCRRRTGLHVHHVKKRSAGGADHEDNLVALCPDCHARTDAPYSKGRLVITACGKETFRFEIVGLASKWLVKTLDSLAEAQG